MVHCMTGPTISAADNIFFHRPSSLNGTRDRGRSWRRSRGTMRSPTTWRARSQRRRGIPGLSKVRATTYDVVTVRLCVIAARSRNLLREIFQCPFPSSDKLEAVGAHLSEFWTLKRALAKGSEPQYVTDIFAALAPHCHGMVSADTSISSAGGGHSHMKSAKFSNPSTS